MPKKSSTAPSRKPWSTISKRTSDEPLTGLTRTRQRVGVAANKVPGVRACLIHETFSAHQGVEDDDLNVICLGGLVVGHALAWELVKTFLAARFSGAERHRRRLVKVAALEAKVDEEITNSEEKS